MKVRKQGYLSSQACPSLAEGCSSGNTLGTCSLICLLPSSHSRPENTHRQREAGACPFVQAVHSWTLAHLLQRWLLLSLRVPPSVWSFRIQLHLRCIECLHYIMYQTGPRWVQRCIRYSSSTHRTTFLIHEKSRNISHHRRPFLDTMNTFFVISYRWSESLLMWN